MGKEKRGWVLAGKILLTVLLSAAELYLLLACVVAFLFHMNYLVWIALALTPLALLLFLWVKHRKRTKRVCGAILLAVWLVSGVQVGVELYRESLIVRTDANIALEEYMPFDPDSKTVTLPDESTLRMDTDLPKLDGAAAVFPVYSAFVNAVYPASAGELNRFDPEPTAFNYYNTRDGYTALAERKTDIFFGAYPSQEQLAYAEECGTTFVFTPIGREAFVFFVSAKSDVDDLSSDDIRRIYAGEVTDWSELGFHEGEIMAFQRNEGSGSQSMFLRFMGDVTPETPPMEKVNDFMAGIYDDVANYKNAKGSIGFSFRYYFESIIARDDVKMISVDCVAPTAENIRSGAYPITADLYAVSWEGNPNENVQALLDWVLGPQGQYLIEETGYVPLS